MADMDFSRIPNNRIDNPTLQDLMFATGYATYMKDRPERSLKDLVPVKVTDAKLPELAWGATPTKNLAYPMSFKSPHAQDEVFISHETRRKGKDFENYVERHEYNHTLDARARTDEQQNAALFHKNNKAEVVDFRQDLVKAIEANKLQLMARYPVLEDSGYIKDPKGAPLAELLSDMNAIQEVYGVDLEKDPMFLKVFRSEKNRALWRAASGTRRTRMDARDPEPYSVKGY